MSTKGIVLVVMVLVVMSLNGVFAASVSEKDSIRAVGLYNEGWRWLNLGWSDDKTRAWHLDSAKASFREALHLAPGYAEPHNGLGWALYYCDSIEAAIRELKIMKEKKPWHRGSYLGIGFIYKDEKKWKDAEQELRMAVALYPYYWFNEIKDDQPRALGYLRTDPDYRRAVTSLSEVLAEQGKDKESKLWSDSVESMKKRSHFWIKESEPLPPRAGHVTVRVLGFARDSLLFRSLPQVIDTAKMEYPPIAKVAGIEGTVKMLLSVDKKGEIIKTQISRSSGNGALDEAALLISKTKFTPPRLKRKSRSKALSVCDLIAEVEFKLDKK